MKKTLTIITIFIAAVGFTQTWNQVAVPTAEKLNDIDFASNTVGYISGDNETLLKTTDGGESWWSISPIGIVVPFVYNIGDLEFVNETIGFCNITNAGATYKTIDGGINWMLVEDMELGNFCYRGTIYAEDETNYFLGGAGCFQSAMIKEFNAGVWTEKSDEMENFNSSEQVNQMDFFNQLGIAATNSRYFLRTIDGGQYWDTILAPLSLTGVITSVAIVDAMNMVAGYNENGGGFGILRSNDAGLTWQQDINSATFYYPAYWSVDVASNGDIYAGAQPSALPRGLMFESTDGINWNYEEVDQAIYAIDSYGSDMTFAIGDSGYVITNVDFGSLSIEEQIEMSAIIYPNPAQDKTCIDLDNSFNGLIQVLDVTGKQIDIGLSKLSDSKFELDLIELETGIYFIHLEEGDNSYVERLVKQ